MRILLLLQKLNLRLLVSAAGAQPSGDTLRKYHPHRNSDISLGPQK
jgi:hypothetical protein